MWGTSVSDIAVDGRELLEFAVFFGFSKAELVEFLKKVLSLLS